MRILPALALAFALLAETAFGAPPLGLPPLPTVPENPQTPEKIRLGAMLFQDADFSSTGEVGCHTCHLPDIAFHDGRFVAQGVGGALGTRNSPSVINAAYAEHLFWDGRAASLEEQALMPLVNPIEHGLTDLEQVAAVMRGKPEYVALAKAAFGVDAGSITAQHFALAVAAFQRTLVFGDSPFDRWHYGGDEYALSPSAQRGFALFTGKAGCASCHIIGDEYALFTDNAFHNVMADSGQLQASAQRWQRMRAGDEDVALDEEQQSALGRFVVTGRTEDIGAFKTPTLRNVARTAPYMHDGRLRSLKDVVRFFNNGGKTKAGASTAHSRYQSPLIQPLKLSASERKDLVAFLESLTSPAFERWYHLDVDPAD